jgi:hypothetical protein
MTSLGMLRSIFDFGFFQNICNNMVKTLAGFFNRARGWRGGVH